MIRLDLVVRKMGVGIKCRKVEGDLRGSMAVMTGGE